MNKFRRVFFLLRIFLFKIKDMFDNKVVKGSKIHFYLFSLLQVIAFPINILLSYIPGLKGAFNKLVKKFPEKDFIIRNRNGAFYVSTSDDTLTASSQNYERDIKRWINLPHEKNIFIDIGSNIGYYTILASREYEQVLGFEPVKKTFSLLKSNIRMNKISNVVCVNQALGEEKRTGLITTNNYSGGNHIIDQDVENAESETVTITTFDEYAGKNKVSPKSISFIKIDVEGFELSVLKGMQNSLRRMKPGSRVMVEIWDRTSNAKKTHSLLKNCGFTLERNYDQDYLFLKN